PGLISSRSFHGGDTPYEIYGPKGIEEYTKVSLGISQTRLSYPLKIIELNETAPIFPDQQFSVSTKKLNHGIDSFGY
ncbi:ribonuclease Z, partial [Enterococcus faecium]